jgi:hypothetical protein
MRTNIWLVFSVLLILVISLSACGPAPAPTAEPNITDAPEPTAASSPTSPPTAAPQASEQPAETVPSPDSAYPAPQVVIVPYNPYPDPIEGEEIEWSQVETLLQNERISEILQQYTLQVVITLEDGRTLLVVEPAKDDIFKLLDACGDSCNNIRRRSEF